MMRAAAISGALGGIRASNGWLVRCPVLSHGAGRGDRNPSLLLSDGETALLAKCFSGCDPRDILAELRSLGLLDRSVQTSRRRDVVSTVSETNRCRLDPSVAERRRLGLGIWNEAGDSRDTPVERWLAVRGLMLSDDVAGTVLKYHPRCPFRLADGVLVRLPAMIALMRDVRSDEPMAIHRTALKPDGSGKSQVPGLGNPRKMLGDAGGAAVKLDDDAEVTHGLAIGEGIETRLAARQLGIRPAWAMASSGNLARFPVLAGIECLTLLAEHDKASDKAVTACAERWHAAGREVVIVKPTIGNDVNDAIRSAA